MNVHDISATLNQCKVIAKNNGRFDSTVIQMAFDNWFLPYSWSLRLSPHLLKCLQKPRIILDEDCLRWTPLIPPPGALIPEELYANLPVIEREEPVIKEPDPQLLESLKKKRRRRWYKAYHGRKRKRKNQKNKKDECNTEDDEDSQKRSDDEEDDSQSAHASQQSQDEDDSATEEETEEEIMRSIQKEKSPSDCQEMNGHCDDVYLEANSVKTDVNNDLEQQNDTFCSDYVPNGDTICEDNTVKESNNESTSVINAVDNSSNSENQSNKSSDCHSNDENADNSSVQTNSESNNDNKKSDSKSETDQLDCEDKPQTSDTQKMTAIPKKIRWQRAVIDESDDEIESVNCNNTNTESNNKDRTREALAKPFVEPVFALNFQLISNYCMSHM